MWLKSRAVAHVEFWIELITWYADKLIKLITITHSGSHYGHTKTWIAPIVGKFHIRNLHRGHSIIIYLNHGLINHHKL